MLVSHAKLEETFRKVQQIQEHMQMCCLAPDRAKLSVEDLQWCIADLYDITIEKREVAFEGTFLHGLVERYAKRARILVRKNQEEDYVRFTSVKELCQVAVTEKEDWSTDGTGTLDKLLFEVHLDLHPDPKTGERESKAAAPHPVQSEKLAEIAAIELMYPFKYRAADRVDLNAGKTTLRALAVHFHAPEFVIGTALHPMRHALCEEFWAIINAKK